MFLNRNVTITKDSDRNRTASLYAASVLGRDDVNKIIGGQAIKVKKADIPRRLLAEVVLMNNGESIPLDTATDAEKEAFPKVIWYSNLGREADEEEDKIFIKDFYACLEALETGKRMTETDEEEEEETTEESGGSETGNKGTGKQKTDTPDAPTDLGISDEAFATLSQEEQIKFIEATQTEAKKLSGRATELAKKVAKDMKRGVKADARIEQLYDLLEKLVKPKDVATVKRLRESNADPVTAATTFFEIDLEQEAEKDAKKKPKKSNKDKPGGPESKKDKSGEPDEPDKPDDTDEGTETGDAADDQPQPKPANPTTGVKLRGAAILASLRKNGMPDEDIKLMAEDLDARAKYDLGEIMDVVRELGYEDSTPVMQALLSSTK